MRILCLLGWHKWKRTTKSKSIDGTVKYYFKCIHCLNKKKLVYRGIDKDGIPVTDTYKVGKFLDNIPDHAALLVCDDLWKSK